MSKVVNSAAIAAMMLVSAAGHAAVFNLQGDGGALGNSAVFVDAGISLTLSVDATQAVVTQSAQGLGISQGGNDARAIDGRGPDEFLTLDFDQLVRLDSISFGSWDSNDRVTFSGLSSRERFGGNSGSLALNEWVQSFSLGAVRNRDDFRIASISVSAVPVPAAAWLFGSALLGLVGCRRKADKV